MWELFGVKPLKYLYFEWSGVEKSEDWLSYFDESCSVSSVLDEAVERCFHEIL